MTSSINFGESMNFTKQSPDAPQEVRRKVRVVVTPEMFEGGFKVLVEARIADDLLEVDKCTVAEIYLAMHRALAHREIR